MKKILILGASIWQLPAIKTAKKLGLEVIVADMNPDAIGFKEEGVICEIVSTIDTEKVLDVAKKHQINGILTVASDMPMRTVATVCEEMGLVGISKETAFNATNKGAMRKSLAAGGVPIPEFVEVGTKEEYLQAINLISSQKIIVKPVDNAGSRGVSLIEDKSNVRVIHNAFDYAKENSRNGNVMVEEYMEGPEVSVETLSVDGVCHVIQITDKLTTGAPHFVEMGHNEPSMLPAELKIQIEEITKAANKAIGIEFGPSHTEVKITPSGLKIVELGARLGGDFITTNLVPLSTGVDMVECCIKIALGDKPDLEKKFNKGSAIRYMETGIGTIKEINGIDEAYKVPGISWISMIHGIGEKAVEIRNSVERVGFVIAQRDTPQEAIESCEEALKKISVIVE